MTSYLDIDFVSIEKLVNVTSKFVDDDDIELKENLMKQTKTILFAQNQK